MNSLAPNASQSNTDKNLKAALRHLNEVQLPQRKYTVEQRGSEYILIDPNGGLYTPADGHALWQRLMDMKNAAMGRQAVKL